MTDGRMHAPPVRIERLSIMLQTAKSMGFTFNYAKAVPHDEFRRRIQWPMTDRSTMRHLGPSTANKTTARHNNPADETVGRGNGQGATLGTAPNDFTDDLVDVREGPRPIGRTLFRSCGSARCGTTPGRSFIDGSNWTVRADHAAT